MIVKRNFALSFRSLAVIGLAGGLAACGGGSGTRPSSSALPAGPTAATLSAATPDPYASAVLADAPSAYYRLDDSGPTAVDSSGNGHNGVVGSGVTKSAAGLLAKSADTAMAFSGRSGDRNLVKIAQTSALQPSNQLSYEAWVKFPVVPGNYNVAFSYGSDASSAPYMLWFDSGHMIAKFTLNTGVCEMTMPPAVLTNTTYFVAATYDGSACRLYINGSQVASKSLRGTISNYSSAGLVIGDDGGQTEGAFKGTVDELAIYGGKVLTASRISAHYAAGTSGTASTAPAGPTAPPAPATATPGPTTTATPNPPSTATPKPVATATAAPVPTQAPAVASAAYTYHGCQVYPAGDTYANEDIYNAARAANSAAIASNWASTGNFDYGDNAYAEEVNLATNATTLHSVAYNGGHNPPMSPTDPAGTQVPWESGYHIEGTVGQNSDGHSQILNTSTCVESEMYGTQWNGSTLSAYAGVNIDLNNSYISQYNYMNATTVAYIPIMGFTDYGEDASAPSINHPLSFFTAGSGSNGSRISKYGFFYPSHTGYVSQGSCTGANNCLHLGDYIRLKASFDCSVYTNIGQLVCNQLKHYGAVYNDDAYKNGFRFGLSADGSNPWNYSVNLAPLFKTLNFSNFDIIEKGTLHCSGSPCV